MRPQSSCKAPIPHSRSMAQPTRCARLICSCKTLQRHLGAALVQAPRAQGPPAAPEGMETALVQGRPLHGAMLVQGPRAKLVCVPSCEQNPRASLSCKALIRAQPECKARSQTPHSSKHNPCTSEGLVQGPCARTACAKLPFQKAFVQTQSLCTSLVQGSPANITPVQTPLCKALLQTQLTHKCNPGATAVHEALVQRPRASTALVKNPPATSALRQTQLEHTSNPGAKLVHKALVQMPRANTIVASLPCARLVCTQPCVELLCEGSRCAHNPCTTPLHKALVQTQPQHNSLLQSPCATPSCKHNPSTMHLCKHNPSTTPF